jgi:hypothetical protein
MTDPVTGGVFQMPTEVPGPRRSEGEAVTVGHETIAQVSLTGEENKDQQALDPSGGTAKEATPIEQWQHWDPVVVAAARPKKLRPPFMRIDWSPRCVETQLDKLVLWATAVGLLLATTLGVMKLYIMGH